MSCSEPIDSHSEPCQNFHNPATIFMSTTRQCVNLSTLVSYSTLLVHKSHFAMKNSTQNTVPDNTLSDQSDQKKGANCTCFTLWGKFSHFTFFLNNLHLKNFHRSDSNQSYDNIAIIVSLTPDFQGHSFKF